MQANEELSAVLRGGLHGRFQSAFHLLENALEVRDDNIAHSVTPAKYDDLHPLLQQVGEQLLLLRRLGEHAADAAIAPVLQDGDPTLLNGLLATLFSNSLAAGRSVHVTLRCAPGDFCYQDDGPGLPQDARDLLLRRGWSGRLLEQGGLGLPLIRAYALAMGWELRVEDAPGMKVHFTLPPCVVDLDEIVMESCAARGERETRRRYFLRELRPVLPAGGEEED